MFDIGWSELLIIGVVALIVVGPKDLPMMFRKVGQFVGKARGLARDFQNAMDQAADESGVKDIGDSLKKATDIKNMGLDDVTNPMKDYAKNFVPGTDSGKSSDAAKEFAASVQKSSQSVKASKAKAAEASVEIKAAAKKPAAKVTAKKTAARKSASKKTAAKSPAAKKPAVKKTVAKKATK